MGELGKDGCFGEHCLNTFFSPYSNADRNFKINIFTFSQEIRLLLRKSIYDYDTDGRKHALTFRFGWSPDHFKASIGSYSSKLSQLNARDLVSLELLQERMSMFLGEPLINTRGVISARGVSEFKVSFLMWSFV